MTAERLFELHVGQMPTDELFVVSFRGMERLSRPFRFDVLLLCLGHDKHDLESELFGETASLVMRDAEGTSRVIAGRIAGLRFEGIDHARGGLLYRLRLVPRLSALKLSKNSRIFQDMSVPEIISAILDEDNLEHRWKLSRDFAKRAYCVQYEESDLAFIERLLGEEGIFYFIEAVSSNGLAYTDRIVFADAAEHYEPIPGDTSILFREPDGKARGREHIDRFVSQRRARPSSFSRSSFDFRRPQTSFGATAKAPEGEIGKEVYAHDLDFHVASTSPEAARTRLEALRKRASEATGHSTVKRLAPGSFFALEEHPLAALNQAYAIVSIEHEGTQPEAGPAAGSTRTYENRFSCVPRDIAYRPRLPKRRHRQIVETATVTGPEGEEIHTDEHGRVKVAFHWDRSGKKDHRSSCWIRAMQPWAGSAWGMQFIPRVGMEVVVNFLGGDTDRPVILGALYNGMNPPPFHLPANKTQSGLKTQSSPGGKGSNELRFEDATGQEQIYVHAQRNLDEVVLNDHSRSVHGREAISVDKSRLLEVAEDNIRTVLGNEVVSIHKNFVLHIAGKQLIRVDGASDPSAPKEEPPQEAPPTTDEASFLEPLERKLPLSELSPQEKLSRAKLLWVGEALSDEAYEVGQIIRSEVDRAMMQLAALDKGIRDVARALDELDEQATMDMLEQIRARCLVLDRRARFTGEALARAIEDNEEPVKPLARLQGAALESFRLAHEKTKALRATLGLALSRAEQLKERLADPQRTEGSEQGGGGGTSSYFDPADIKFQDYRNDKGDPDKLPPGLVGSKLEITGGGEIDSKHGFKITCGGSVIEITPGSISITSPGPISLNGSPIKLNC